MVKMAHADCETEGQGEPTENPNTKYVVKGARG